MKLQKKEFTELPSYIINVKIHSDNKDKQELYSSIFRQIYNFSDFSVKIGNKNGLDLKKLDKISIPKSDLGQEFKDLEYDNYEVFLGEFIKYKIEDENDKHYNTKSKELKPGDPNAIEKPNAIQIPFYIIPAIHRIFLPVKSRITPLQAKLFFEKALLEIYESEEFFNIDIAKSTEAIEKIYKFAYLKKLQLFISYTNDDLGGDAKIFMDTLLKDANVNKCKTEYNAEKNESLNVDAKLIKGGIELSKENGELIAIGENEYGNKEIVNTKNKFEEYSLKIKNGFNPLISVLKDTLKNWRL